MQPPTARRQGFVQIPNWLVDDENLTAAEKWSVISIARRAYGAKKSAWPSQAKIAKTGGFDRKTIRRALQHVVELGILKPLRHRPRGVVEYEVNLESAPPPEAYTPGDVRRTPQVTCGVIPTKHSKVKRQEKNSRPESVTSNAEVSVDRGDTHGNVNGECSAYNPPEAYTPGQLTKREANEQCLTPEGQPVCGDFHDLYTDLNVLTLPEVGGELIPEVVLERLVELRGLKFCLMWNAWLKRKIAEEYRKRRPVKNPSGLYITAVEQGWEVNPSWPEFDETLHITQEMWERKMGITGQITDDELVPF
jgi:Helix-turn-helix domain